MLNEIGSRHRHLADKSRGRLFKVRNVLNIVFMLGAVIGMMVYALRDHTVGIIIVLAAMVFKITECCLRFIHR